MYKVILLPPAEKFYAQADLPLAKRLKRCFTQLAANPRGSNNSKRFSGKLSGYWRYRVGDWRVIYRIEDEVVTVLVVDIAHRGEVYE